MTDEPLELLVLGLGNLLCEDDGAGVVAANALAAQFDVPPGVRVLDGGTLGLALLPWIRSARRVILVDAILGDGPPGTIVRLEGGDVAHAAAHRLSVHQVGVLDLLDSNRLLGGGPEEVVLWGVVPAEMGLSVELTPDVRAAIPELVSRVAAEVRALGFDLADRRAVA